MGLGAIFAAIADKLLPAGDTAVSRKPANTLRFPDSPSLSVRCSREHLQNPPEIRDWIWTEETDASFDNRYWAV